MRTTVTCPWCKAVAPNPGGDCDRCGGPLPAEGAEPGVAPPPPPRTLPPAFVRRVRFTSNVLFIIGSVFAMIGIPLAVALAIGGLVAGEATLVGLGGLFGVTFGLLGAVMARFGVRAANKTLRALEHGIAGLADVTNVSQVTSESINGRHPWRVSYVFQTPRGSASGDVKTYDDTAADRKKGDRVHVVYVADDPSISSIWPPLG